jgi:hypothetical protein
MSEKGVPLSMTILMISIKYRIGLNKVMFFAFENQFNQKKIT